MNQVPKFDKVHCSQCGGEFGPRDSGYSHCIDHRAKADPVVAAALAAAQEIEKESEPGRSLSDLTMTEIIAKHVEPSAAQTRNALRLCHEEIRQFHSLAYPDCDGGCPAHQAMAAASAVLNPPSIPRKTDA